MFNTAICEILGIRYPIIQGGMAWVSEHNLIAAVSNAGGLGILAAGNLPGEDLTREILETQKLTDKPFGVNIVPIAGVKYEDHIKIIADEGVKIVALAFSDPKISVISELHKHSITVICVVPSVRLAKRVEGEGADIIVAMGTEAGGHVGKIATMPLVPQVVDAVDVPVVAAGGICDGRGLLAALSLGAEGIQMGTRFMVSRESVMHPRTKARILSAGEEDTIVTGALTGTPMRSLRNEFTQYWDRREREEGHRAKEDLQKEGLGRGYRVIIEGDMEQGTLPMGQGCGLVREETGVKEIIEGIISQAETAYRDIGGT